MSAHTENDDRSVTQPPPDTQPGVLIGGVDTLLAEVRDARNPAEWRCRALLALDEMIAAARARGQTRRARRAPRRRQERAQ